MIPLNACDIQDCACEVKKEHLGDLVLRLIEISNKKNANPLNTGFELIIYNGKAYRICATKIPSNLDV